MQYQTPREGRFSWAGLLRMAGLVCMALSWLMPNHYVPWYFFHSDALAFAAVFLWLVSLQFDGPGANSVPRAAWVVFAAIAIPWLQWAFGLIGFAGEAWLATLYIGGFAASLYVGFQWGRRPDGERAVMQTVVFAVLAAGLGSTVLALFQWLRMEDDLGIFIANIGITVRPFANFGQPNLLATLLVMSVVALVWLYQANLLGKLGLVVGTAFLTFGLCLTQSRAGYVSALAICLWWFFKERTVGENQLKRWWGAAWLVSIAVFTPLLRQASVVFGWAGDRQILILDNNGRWLIWKQISQGILDSPWVGYGWEHTAAAQMAGSVTYPGTMATMYAHNIGLDALAWLGIPLGLAACLAAGLWLASRAFRARGQLPVLAFALALPVISHSLLEFPFAYAVFLFPAGILLGVVEAGHPGAPVAQLRRGWLLALGLVWGALGIQVVREYLPAEDDFRFLRFEAMRIGKTPDEHTRPQFVLLTQMEALLEVGRIKPRAGMSEQEIDNVRYVTTRYSWSPPAILYAAVLEANGRQEAYERQLKVILGMYGKKHLAAAMERLEELRAQRQPSVSLPARQQ